MGDRVGEGDKTVMIYIRQALKKYLADWSIKLTLMLDKLKYFTESDEKATFVNSHRKTNYQDIINNIWVKNNKTFHQKKDKKNTIVNSTWNMSRYFIWWVVALKDIKYSTSFVPQRFLILFWRIIFGEENISSN